MDGFRYVFMVFVIVNLPLIVLMIYPFSEDVKSPHAEDEVIPCVVEEEIRRS